MSILDEILSIKKEEVSILRRDYSLSRYSDFEYFNSKKIDFKKALNRSDKISIIAEVKKASPSKGIIREDFNPENIAKIYMGNGASAISVLTDKNFFQGSTEYMKTIASFKSIPLLRKDFIIDEYQIYEAKAFGADAILLISEALSKQQISELSQAAYETDLDVLLEFHSIEEIKKIDFNLNKVIGVNNRDLNTFKVDISTTLKALTIIPQTNIVVSESGISMKDNIDTLLKTNTNAILVGEHLMRQNNIGKALSELNKWCSREN